MPAFNQDNLAFKYLFNNGLGNFSTICKKNLNGAKYYNRDDYHFYNKF